MLTRESNSQRTVLFAIKITFERLSPHNECTESFFKTVGMGIISTSR
jgi:hypothetical protein